MLTRQARPPLRILWIAYTFPPVGGKQGLRMRRYLEEITKAAPGAAIDVLTICPDTGTPQYDQALSAALPEGVHVWRVRPGILHYLRYRCRLDALAFSLPPGRRRQAVGAAIRLSNCAWLPRAAALLWRERHRRYDAIYAFVDPFASIILVLAALWLKVGTTAVLEYGDPRIPCRKVPRPVLAIAARVEEKALLRSSAAVFRTVEAVQLYQSRYPAVPAVRYHVIYGGADWEDYDAITAPSGGGEFRMVYTGTIYAESADPSPFMQAVANVAQRDGPRITVLVAGAANPVMKRLCDELRLGGIIRFLGHVPAARLAEVQRSASVLLAFGLRNPYKISSKLAEYFAARAPILYLAESPAEPGAQLVARASRGMVVPNDTIEITESIQRARVLWERSELWQQFDLSRTGEFSWSEGASMLMSLLSNPELEWVT